MRGTEWSANSFATDRRGVSRKFDHNGKEFFLFSGPCRCGHGGHFCFRQEGERVVVRCGREITDGSLVSHNNGPVVLIDKLK